MTSPHDPAVESHFAELSVPFQVFNQRIADLGGTHALHCTAMPQPIADDEQVKNRCAPISSLPDELLMMIFKAHHEMPNMGGALRPEVIVSHVTSRWREVALSAPFLWTTINVTPKPHFEAIASYLDRSKLCSVDLRLIFPITDIAAIFDMVIPHVARWRSISLEDLRGDFEDVFMALRDLAAPQLQHIAITSYYVFPSEDDSRFWLFKGGTPILSAAQLEGLGMFCCWPSITSLTTLYLQNPDFALSYAHFRQMLTGLFSLTCLVIWHAIVDEASWLENTEATELHSLRSLQIHGLGRFPHISDLLLAIVAPRLESLSFCGGGVVDLSHFIEYQTKQGTARFPALRSLTLTAGFDASKYLAEAFPSIIQLSLFYTSSDSILGYMKYAENSLDPWPHLHTLTVYPFCPNEEVLCDVVSARIAAGKPLARLRVTGSTLSSFKRAKWLRKQVQVEEITSDEWDETNSHALL